MGAQQGLGSSVGGGRQRLPPHRGPRGHDARRPQAGEPTAPVHGATGQDAV